MRSGWRCARCRSLQLVLVMSNGFRGSDLALLCSEMGRNDGWNMDYMVNG
jgi:hypothetical protein